MKQKTKDIPKIKWQLQVVLRHQTWGTGDVMISAHRFQVITRNNLIVKNWHHFNTVIKQPLCGRVFVQRTSQIAGPVFYFH